MSRPKKQKNNSEPEVDSELYLALIGLNTHEDKACELMCILEAIPQDSNPYALEFCKAYTIFLFQEYIDENDREMMLAICGLLKGFEFKPRKFAARMWKYREHAKYYNDFFNGKISPTSIAGMCRNELLRIARELERKLTIELAKNEGKLGLIDNIPKELKLPIPHSIPKHNINDHALLEEVIGDTTDSKPSGDNRGDIHAFLLVTCLISMVISFVSLIITQGGSNEQTVTSEKENTPQIEAFHVFDEFISLQPYQSQEIKVGLYPNDADKNDLNCISDDIDIAIVDNLIVTAKDWQEGHDTTKVTVGYRDIGNVKVPIIVETPNTADKLQQDEVSEKINPNDGNGEYK